MTLLAAPDAHTLVFYLFALVACVFGLAVLFSNNIVRMAFFLVVSLGATSGLFFLAGAEFVGAMQLLIYVGGTLVLLVFGVMLTAQSRFITMKTNAGEWVLGIVIGSSLLTLLLATAFNVRSWRESNLDPGSQRLADTDVESPLGLALSGIRADGLDEADPARRRGMSGYAFPFVIVSMHLVVVLIGAAYLARTKVYRATAFQPVAVAPVPHRIRWAPATVLLGVAVAADVVLLATIAGVYWFCQDAAVSSSQAKWASLALTDRLVGAGGMLLTMPILGVAALFHCLCLAALLYFQKWGLAGLVIIAVAVLVPIHGALGTPATVVATIGQVALLALIWVALRGGGERNMWTQME